MAKGKKSKTWVAIIIVLLMLLTLFIGLYMGGFFEGETRQERDTQALEGLLPGKSEEAIEDILNQVVDEGMFNITINPDVIFEDGSSEGKVNIENIPANLYSMQVSIAIDETGEVIYESKLIDPGFYIESVELIKPLEAGEYPCTATFTAFDIESGDEIGRAAAKITVYVLN